MELELNTRKKLQDTANEYFEQAKKLRKKAEGARETVLKFKKELELLEKKQKKKELAEEKEERIKPAKKEWYEKFRWFISSEGFLCIGGRDATTNEIVVKKHTDKDDIVFHTEAPGSPFFVVKTKGKKPSDLTLQEAADATTSFSKAWKLGISVTDAFAVSPEQLSKTAQAGEYMAKGAFMIRGKRTHYTGSMNVWVGKLADGRAMAAPESAIRANCKEFIHIKQGRGKTSDCAKKIAKKIGVHVDDVVRVLPAGGCRV